MTETGLTDKLAASTRPSGPPAGDSGSPDDGHWLLTWSLLGIWSSWSSSCS